MVGGTVSFQLRRRMVGVINVGLLGLKECDEEVDGDGAERLESDAASTQGLKLLYTTASTQQSQCLGLM